jgi:molybdopterin/thiamine biosynthesis adenylyltransferase
MKENTYLKRYAAQIPVIGTKNQIRIRDARVHVAGCGGLGSMIIFMLTALGVRNISSNDPQLLELDNLNRFLLGEEFDIGRNKVIAAARFLDRTPELNFRPLVARNESIRAAHLFKQADWIFSCANSFKGRSAAAERAIAHNKPIIDVGVADGRKSLGGGIRCWLPQWAAWSACPACYLQVLPEGTGEGLLASVLFGTAAMATHAFVALLTGKNDDPEWNFIEIGLQPFRIEQRAVNKRRTCHVCHRQASARIG